MTPKRKKKRAPDASKYTAVSLGAITLGVGGMRVDLGGKACGVPGYRLPARANTKLHWAQIKAQRQLGQRMAALLPPLEGACVITLTRVSPGRLDSHDGVGMAFKAIVDDIADVLVGKPVTIKRKGRTVTKLIGDDSDPRITWRYEQRKGPYAIEAMYEQRGGE